MTLWAATLWTADLWSLVYQASAADKWLLEAGGRWVLEDGSGYWLLES